MYRQVAQLNSKLTRLRDVSGNTDLSQEFRLHSTSDFTQIGLPVALAESSYLLANEDCVYAR